MLHELSFVQSTWKAYLKPLRFEKYLFLLIVPERKQFNLIRLDTEARNIIHFNSTCVKLHHIRQFKIVISAKTFMCVSPQDGGDNELPQVPILCSLSNVYILPSATL